MGLGLSSVAGDFFVRLEVSTDDLDAPRFLVCFFGGIVMESSEALNEDSEQDVRKLCIATSMRYVRRGYRRERSVYEVMANELEE